MNTFYKHKDDHKWTWYRWNYERQEYTYKSIIDMIITNNKTIFNDVKSIPSLSCEFDHRMVIGKINFIQPKSVKGPIRKRFTIKKLTNPEVAL